MKLNNECVRDTLLYLEDKLTLNFQQRTFNSVNIQTLIEEMMLIHTSYEANDIWYVVYQLKQAGFIEGRFENAARGKMYVCEIESITWSGHQFLDSIRLESIWHIIKAKTNQIGNLSISGLSIMATTIIQEIAKDPAFIQNIVHTLIS